MTQIESKWNILRKILTFSLNLVVYNNEDLQMIRSSLSRYCPWYLPMKQKEIKYFQ